VHKSTTIEWLFFFVLWLGTRPDPTRPGRFWPGDPTRSLSVCALNWEIILTTVCYHQWMLSAKSPWSIQYTHHDVKTQSTQNPTDAKMTYSLPKSACKNYKKKRVRYRVCHTDPWSDPTWPKSSTRWPVSRRPGSNTGLNINTLGAKYSTVLVEFLSAWLIPMSTTVVDHYDAEDDSFVRGFVRCSVRRWSIVSASTSWLIVHQLTYALWDLHSTLILFLVRLNMLTILYARLFYLFLTGLFLWILLQVRPGFSKAIKG